MVYQGHLWEVTSWELEMRLLERAEWLLLLSSEFGLERVKERLKKTRLVFSPVIKYEQHP